MVKTVQRADHAQLRSLTAVGIKEFPLLLVLRASDLNWMGRVDWLGDLLAREVKRYP